MAQRRSRSEDILAVTRKRYWRESDARMVVKAWKQSGQSASGFARAHGVKATRLLRWAERLGVGSSRKVHFHPVRLVGTVGEKGAGEGLEVVLVDGRRVRVPSGFAVEDLARVLAVLEGEAC